jgi:ribosomal protein L11 methyltransferase
MMVAHLIGLKDLAGKKVMDAGCGTGILAIVASKLGASSVVAFDIEEWAIENSQENAKQNHIDNIYVSIGTVSTVYHQDVYDIIVANINKNVLLEEIPKYSHLMRDKGLLFLSGFYEQDVDDINEVAKKYSLAKSNIITKNNWASLVYEKNST